MRLWHLLLGICVAMPLGGSLGTAVAAKASIRGFAVAAIVGLIVGGFYSWLMWRKHKAFVARYYRREEPGQQIPEWVGGLFYLSKALWIVFAVLLSIWLSSLSQRLAC